MHPSPKILNYCIFKYYVLTGIVLYQENPGFFLVQVALKYMPFFEIPFVYTLLFVLRDTLKHNSVSGVWVFFFKKIVSIPH